MLRFIYVITLILLTHLCNLSYGQEKESRQVQPFHSIKTAGLVQVYLQEGDKERLRLEVSGIDLNDIITTVENGVLTIKTEGNYNGENIQVYATYKQIQRIAVSGASKLFGKSIIKSKNLDVSTSGAGDAFLEVDVDFLTITMEEDGNLTITGKADTEKIVASNLDGGTLDRTGLVTSQ